MTSVATYRVEPYGDIDVCWLPELDGGGRAFGQDYVPVVRQLFGRVGRVFEFCAGPGFIGFALLAHGLCDSLTVADVNPRAVEALRETVRRNGLDDRVTVYHSDGLADIPPDERWDLVVGNPPHFASPFHGSRESLITDDLGWRLHRAFYRDVGRFLSDGGSVLLQENSKGSSPRAFLPMLRDGGLEHVRTVWYPPNGQSCFYYLWAKRSGSGLIFDPAEAPTYDVELTDPASTLDIGGGVLRLRLCNRLARGVHPRLISDRWHDQLRPIRPNEIQALPPLAFRAGTYVVADASTGEDGRRLAVITVSDRS